jgi:diguanylate cyclase (GGDEF)-like protein/PAS domain S-box-containing protein
MAKILVVDDHAPSRELLAALIRSRGHLPLEAEDGAQALVLVRAHHPQVVVSDVLMPTMDGYEFVRQLRADPAVADTEVIFYTAHYREREAQALARACGVLRVIAKPCPSEEILRVIDDAAQRPLQAAQVSVDLQDFDRDHLRLMTDKLSEKLEDLRGANQRLAALTDLNLRLASERDPEVLLDKVCRGARDLLAAKYAVLGLDDPGRGDKPFFTSGIQASVHAELERPQLAAPLLAKLRKEGRAHGALNPGGDPAALGLPAGYPPLHNALLAPIASITRGYGWICLADKLGGDDFDGEDHNILTALAAQVGRIYENGLLYAQVQGHVEELRNEIAQRQAQQAQLHLSRQVLEQSHESILIADAQLNIVMVNHAFTLVSGFSAVEMRGKTTHALDSARYDQAFFDAMREAVLADGTWAGELWSRRKDGSEYPAWLTVKAIKDAQGQVCNYAFISRDISEQKAAEERISWLSHFDALTGLPNRVLLADRCNHELAVAQRDAAPLAMVVVGLDQFKLVNDTMGHGKGDQLLQQFAQRLVGTLREQDTVARIHGDEFAMVLPGHMAEGAGLLANRLLHVIGEPYDAVSSGLGVTASIGIALYPSDGQDFDSLFKAAEVAMHQAQRLGFGQHQFFNAQEFESTMAQVALAAALRNAIARDQLVLNYQPFGDLLTGRVGGMEALLRWEHPELGAVPPGRFIPVAEQSGLVGEIGTWVLRQVCRDICEWRSRGLAVPPVSVNISPVQFRDPKLVALVERTLREFDIEPGSICLEVTEGVLIEDVAHAKDLLRALRALGVQLSLDDFGTGYSSLSYLKAFPFDKVKIDQAFVRDIIGNPSDAVIAKSIILLAHGLGLRVIAEGVETEVQCEFMRGNVCDEVQGYFFSRPVPMAQMEALLHADLRLPAHLLRMQARQRTLLLVDDEPNVLASLKRLLRRDGYQILTADGGVRGLELLAKNPVDIIVSDQRMPGMTGVEFLRQAKALYPKTIRIVLSGYTELKSVTDAINEGAVYRFLTKPWDDDQLRAFIEDAFRHKELADENEQLTLKIRTANQELASSNRQLQEVLSSRQRQFAQREQMLNVVRDVLQHVPIPVIGIDDDGLIAFANARAEELFAHGGSLLGNELAEALPELDALLAGQADGRDATFQAGGDTFRAQWHSMGSFSASSGKLITFSL